MPEPPKCDFCSARPITWDYPCRDFIHTPTPDLRRYVPRGGSRGGWAACDTCHDLIEKGDRRGLADRSARSHPQRRMVGLKTLRKMTRGLHDDFWAHREGPPFRVEVEHNTT